MVGEKNKQLSWYIYADIAMAYTDNISDLFHELTFMYFLFLTNSVVQNYTKRQKKAMNFFELFNSHLLLA